MGDVINLPMRRRRPADPLAEEIGLVSARLYYLARDLKCVAAHARDPDEALILANWMSDMARDLGEDALGLDLEGG